MAGSSTFHFPFLRNNSVPVHRQKQKQQHQPSLNGLADDGLSFSNGINSAGMINTMATTTTTNPTTADGVRSGSFVRIGGGNGGIDDSGSSDNGRILGGRFLDGHGSNGNGNVNGGRGVPLMETAPPKRVSPTTTLAKTLSPVHKSVTSSTSSKSSERPDPSKVDDILSKEMMQMSFQERSKIQEEVHGVRNVMEDAFPVETPQLLQSALIDLHRCLAQMPLQQKLAWSEAHSLPVTYVRDTDFELRFLRCELFDAVKAAVRLVSFVDMVKDYFGPIALQRPPRLDDFEAEEMDAMKVGTLLQVLPFRDRSGRKIFTCVGDFGLQIEYRTRVSWVCACFVFLCVLFSRR
jgi:hypothetical protein